jgi:hypothetical protein
MLSGSFLKKPWVKEEDFALYLERMIENIKGGSWEEASINLKKLKTAWKKVLPRLQFSIERDEAIEIDVNLARLQGFLSGKDRPAALAELYEVYERWNNLSE